MRSKNSAKCGDGGGGGCGGGGDVDYDYDDVVPEDNKTSCVYTGATCDCKSSWNSPL